MNIYQLPPELFNNLVLRRLQQDVPLPQSPSDEPQLPKDNAAGSHQGIRSASCSLCVNASFVNSDDQRAHYKSDWHKYNVKAKLLNKPLLSETQFLNAIANLSDSISGSESTDSEDVSSDHDAVTSALKRARIADRAESPTALEGNNASIPRSAIQWFHSSPSTQLGIYRAIFPLGMESSNYVREIQSMQIRQDRHSTNEERRDEKLWTLLMIAGGHFAGMVVRITGSQEHLNKGKAKHKHPEYDILLHKTFHRYTTRRKQGGSQSVNDNAKGPAKSAGAMLRRYGEQALKDDIRNLMNEWSEEIQASERIWIRANVANKRIFYDYDAAIFTKDDQRLRGFPFITRRPTQAELVRCLNELLFAKITHFTEAELKQQDDEYISSLPKPKPAPVIKSISQEKKPKEDNVPKLTKEQEEQRDIWKRILEMTRKGRVDALSTFWTRISSENAPKSSGSRQVTSIDMEVPQLEGLDVAGDGWTLLHVAALAGQEAVISWLIEEMNANPTLNADTSSSRSASGETKKTPYELASSKSTRDLFRRLAAKHPEKWDWLGSGRIPSVLSKEMEEEQGDKRKARRKGLKDKMKEREERQNLATSVEPDSAVKLWRTSEIRRPE
ncbi:hypothetical protein CPB86DRAFT_821333 [Serendipita vermifera]|nr:hypothetical protein CPB86DRAFT_821333 [Serendipita vermifera]